jgi:polygalacturonase
MLVVASAALVALVASIAGASSGGGESVSAGCSVADFGAVADNKTDGTKAFRAAAMSGCSEILVPPGVWMT